MIALTDAELDAIINAAKPLRPKDRDPFLRALAVELEKHRGEFGPGLINRMIRTTQRQFFDPPISTARRSTREADLVAPSGWRGAAENRPCCASSTCRLRSAMR
jgi:hypothetical protein